MDKAIRITAGIPGVLFLLQGIGWLVAPARAAEGLGMPLLDGLGRSSQVGDFAAFFLALAVMIGLGVIGLRGHWLRAAALLLGLAAIGRVLAWAVHGAAFALPMILVEVVFAALLFFAAGRIDAQRVATA